MHLRFFLGVLVSENLTLVQEMIWCEDISGTNVDIDMGCKWTM